MSSNSSAVPSSTESPLQQYVQQSSADDATGGSDPYLSFLVRAGAMQLGLPPADTIFNPIPGYPPSSYAEGGSTNDDSHSALAWLKRKIANSKPLDQITYLEKPYMTLLDRISGGPSGRARIAVRAAQQLYGVDPHGNPVFLGGIFHRGATPPGIVDEALSVPDSMAGLEEAIMNHTPGPKGNSHDLIHALDPQWSRNATARLQQLARAVQKDTGIGDPQTLGQSAEDLTGQIGPLLVGAKLLPEASLARKALDQIAGWGAAGSAGPQAKPKVSAANTVDDSALLPEGTNADVDPDLED